MRFATSDGSAEAICPEIHDLAIAKLLAGRPKDLEWLHAAVAARLLDPSGLDELLSKAATTDDEREPGAIKDRSFAESDVMERQDRARRAYLERVFRLMQGPAHADIVAKASALIARWDGAGIHPKYPQQWHALLEGDVEAMQRAALADTSEAADLRHCMPFARILSNQERRAIRQGQSRVG